MARHRAAFEYDWRARFRLPLTVVGKSMTWGEAVRLSGLLAKDPTSQLAAALSDWLYPATRESLVLMDYYDAYSHATFKHPAPYPRPWDAPVKRIGRASYTTDELRRVLTIQRNAEGVDDG